MKYLNKMKTAFFIILSFTAINALADDFFLTINNNTNDGFNATARPARPLRIMLPHEQKKVYALNFMPDRPTPEFALLLTANNGEKASVIYQYPNIFCNPQSIYYRCSFTNISSHSATLELSTY